jgi:hypothetical protein
MAERDYDQGAAAPKAKAGIIATELSRQRLDQLAKDGWIARHAPGHWRVIDLRATFDSCAMKVVAQAFTQPTLVSAMRVPVKSPIGTPYSLHFPRRRHSMSIARVETIKATQVQTPVVSPADG